MLHTLYRCGCNTSKQVGLQTAQIHKATKTLQNLGIAIVNEQLELLLQYQEHRNKS